VAPRSIVVEAAEPRRVDRPGVAAAYMLFACLLFTFMALFVKRATRDVSFLEAAAGRAGFGALTIVAMARARGVSLRVSDRGLQWRRTLAGTASMCCGFYALSRLPLGDAVTIGNLTPLMLAVLSPVLLGERSGSSVWAAVVLGLAGVGLLAGVHLAHPGGLWLGLLAGIGGAFFSSLAMAFLRRLGKRESPEGVSLHFATWAAVITLLLSLPGFRAPTAVALLALAGAGVFGGVAQVAMTRAYALDQAARVSAVGYSGVVFSQAIGVALLHEVPTRRQLAGAGLVLSSGVLLALSGKPARSAGEPEVS
jgi:drug/metabolite transporter (DMT)-like permease